MALLQLSLRNAADVQHFGERDAGAAAAKIVPGDFFQFRRFAKFDTDVPDD